MSIKSILGMVLVLLLPLGQANALLLDNWNDVDLDVSGDFISVDTGTYNNDTWFSMSWQAGSADSLMALGIDTVFYNFSNSTGSGDIISVWEGSLGGADVTADWHTNFGGDESGGGFGSFTSLKSLEAGGTNGVDPSVLYFLLGGDVTFASNANGSTFAAHVRYEESCSGWVSDGTTESTDSGSCGSSVPEPGVVGLLAVGLLGMVAARRRAKV